MRVSFETVTTSLGPGKRYVIWVQGCDKRCEGCINPAGWNRDGGTERNTDELFGEITSYSDLTGVTISGGEPFLQLEELCSLITLIKEKSSLDIMVYTGYTVEALAEKFGAKFEMIKAMVDILVDGEYIRGLNTGSMYRGSDNQRIFFFTEKYRSYSDKIMHSKQRDFSFKIANDGEVYFIGIPPVGFYEQFLAELGG